jgi:hypothetical protein
LSGSRMPALRAQDNARESAMSIRPREKRIIICRPIVALHTLP